MSSLLYALGRGAFRHRVLVLLGWLTALLVSVGGLGLVGAQADDSFSIPGTEAQQALDELEHRFPEAGGSTAQVVFVAPDGERITGERSKAAVEASVDRLGRVDGVTTVSDPYTGDTRMVSDDGRMAVAQAQADVPATEVDDATREALTEAAEPARAEGLRVEYGGEVFRDVEVHVGLTEVVGVVIALVVLILTFRALLPAFMPLVTAVVGVGVAMPVLLLLSNVMSISSTTPVLALMIGLAVGIDYALFILSRHRAQLADGMAPEESTARAIATAGSAVVFAGVTVIIALCGLAIAGIPFLAVMGAAAAATVAVAVAVALTLLPASFGFLGERLRPKPRRQRQRPAPRTAGQRWASAVTRWPVVTVLLVVTALGLMAWPAKDLALAMPDNGTAEPASTQREAYDLIADGFGPGYNAPLVVTADILQTTDPVRVVDELADDLERMPGAAEVTLATPNQNADTAIVQVIPYGAGDSDTTKQLVQEIRDRHDHYAKAYDIDTAVTGQTAIDIDTTQRLTEALPPFGLVVVGLSLVLVAVVFRSIAVPLKATAGYALSVAAAFGAVAAVFEWGWLADLLDVQRTGPVLNFLPIMLMGVLFGLAMDYEVFLVSRMREEYVHRGRAREAVMVGYTSGVRVVAAAAVIMISVFAAFVPSGNAMLKPIAFGLAVGVLVDAFLVRMTLVPAVMVLLRDKAWWLPRWLERRLPRLDVEGEAIERRLRLADRLPMDGSIAVRSDELGLALPAGDTLLVTGTRPAVDTFLLTIAGRLPVEGEPLVVDGLVLPDDAARVRSRVALVDPPGAPQPDTQQTAQKYVSSRITLHTWRPWRRRALVRQLLDRIGVPPRTPLSRLAPARRRVLVVAAALAERPAVLVLHDPAGLDSANWLRDPGTTVVVGSTDADPAIREGVTAVLDLEPQKAIR